MQIFIVFYWSYVIRLSSLVLVSSLWYAHFMILYLIGYKYCIFCFVIPYRV